MPTSARSSRRSARSRARIHPRPPGQGAGDDAVIDAHDARMLCTRHSCRYSPCTVSSPCRPATSSRSCPDANARQFPGPRSTPAVGRPGRPRHPRHPVQNVGRSPARPDPSPADSAIRPPGRPPAVQPADHLGSGFQRGTHDADHRAHRPGRRPRTIEVIRLEHASAAEIVRVVDPLTRAQKPKAAAARGHVWWPTSVPTACWLAATRPTGCACGH